MLPSPDVGVDPSAVPERFLLPGTQVRKVSDEGGVDVYALNIPFGVTEAFDRYRKRLGPPDYQEIAVDNEGFEAEIYLRESSRGRLLAIQIRQPRCTEASAVFVSVDNRPR